MDLDLGQVFILRKIPLFVFFFRSFVRVNQIKPYLFVHDAIKSRWKNKTLARKVGLSARAAINMCDPCQ